MTLKTQVFVNRVKTDYKTDFSRAVAYFAKHNVTITFDFHDVDVHGYPVSTFHYPQGDRILVSGTERLVPIDPTYDITIFAFDAAEFTVPNIPTSNCFTPVKQPFINLATHINNPVGLDQNTIEHECMHAVVVLANQKGLNVRDVMDIDTLGRLYYLNDQPDNPLSNFGQQWNLLAVFIKPMETYIYFKPSEIVNLKPELVRKLDQARGIAGVPFIITSGYRSPAQNALVGGVQDSSHETGLAVDLLIKDGISGEKINSALHQVGFTRFGYYGDSHLHVDMATDKPTPCYWVKP